MFFFSFLFFHEILLQVRLIGWLVMFIRYLCTQGCTALCHYGINAMEGESDKIVIPRAALRSERLSGGCYHDCE